MPDYSTYTDEQLIQQVLEPLLCGLGMCVAGPDCLTQGALDEVRPTLENAIPALEELHDRLRNLDR